MKRKRNALSSLTNYQLGLYFGRACGKVKWIYFNEALFRALGGKYED